MDNSPIPWGQNGTAVPRVQKGPAYKETPRVRRTVCRKNYYIKTDLMALRTRPMIRGWPRLPVARQHLSRTPDDAHDDAEIVALFDDVAEGWELLERYFE